jgi:hypothetical protein
MNSSRSEDDDDDDDEFVDVEDDDEVEEEVEEEEVVVVVVDKDAEFEDDIVLDLVEYFLKLNERKILIHIAVYWSFKNIFNLRTTNGKRGFLFLSLVKPHF